ncbi:MAG: extracellular solute-binding protein [Planctomycetales bacterium]|nr:extracellular solute-binding protein [Planctomycetales bacterium]
MTSIKPSAARFAAVAASVVFVALSACGATKAVGLREEVVFWHFWGGRDRPIVEEIVEHFNTSQTRYTVRAIAMPGSNLDLKFFLSVAGGDPPDLLNHDDPVVADWAHRGVLTPLDEIATADELSRLRAWLFPAALQLGSYHGKLYALCNGLDIRALYCNKTLLTEHGLDLPETIADLDHIAETIAPPGQTTSRLRMGYLPDPRRLWAWGVVFGGSFANLHAETAEQMITADSPEIVAALAWMADYGRRYGPSEVAAFRSGEQALTGAAFPLLADRRYAVVMDGQWRVRDLETARQANPSLDVFAVKPLPAPPGGRKNAGWVNGNFFVVPGRARHKQGAWEFMKYWSGFDGHEAGAAVACAAGGWIPASQHVVDQPAYQQALHRWPLLKLFVQLAASPDQVPVPPLPVGSLYYNEVVQAAQEVLYRGADPATELGRASNRVRARLSEVLDER